MMQGFVFLKMHSQTNDYWNFKKFHFFTYTLLMVFLKYGNYYMDGGHTQTFVKDLSLLFLWSAFTMTSDPHYYVAVKKFKG